MSVTEDSGPGPSGEGSPLVAVVGAAGLGLAGLLVGLLLGLVSISLANVFVPLSQGSTLTTAIAMVAQGVGLVVVGGAYLVQRGASWSYLGVRWPSLRDIGWAIAVTIGLFVVLAAAMFVIEQLGLTATEHSVAEAAEENPELLLPLIPLSVLVTGPAEELLFRGVIQTRLREVFGSVPAVGLAALVFSLVHIPAYSASSGLDASLVTTLGVLLILGAFLGGVYEHTGNLMVPAVAHGLYNAVVFGATYAETITALV
jgi:membrane protease YdiL (CAAX protease family)